MVTSPHGLCQVFQRDCDRRWGQIGLRWPTPWDSPPRGSYREPSQGPGAQLWKICLLEKLSRRQLRWPRRKKSRVSGASTAVAPFVTLATHQILRVWALGQGVGGQTGASVSGGERAVSSPLPLHGCLRILDVGEAAGPFPRAAAACLSPWQPGQKTNLPRSRLRSLPWSRVLTCLSGSQSTVTPRSLW